MLRENCGIVAAAGGEVADILYHGLRIIQHRGQESAGIATFKDGIKIKTERVKDAEGVATGYKFHHPIKDLRTDLDILKPAQCSVNKEGTLEWKAFLEDLLGERLRQRLLLVDDALEAIEHEEYGLCEECEEPINEKRLLLMPFTRLCVSCQSELERQARIRGNP